MTTHNATLFSVSLTNPTSKSRRIAMRNPSTVPTTARHALRPKRLTIADQAHAKTDLANPGEQDGHRRPG